MVAVYQGGCGYKFLSINIVKRNALITHNNKLIILLRDIFSRRNFCSWSQIWFIFAGNLRFYQYSIFRWKIIFARIWIENSKIQITVDSLKKLVISRVFLFSRVRIKYIFYRTSFGGFWQNREVPRKFLHAEITPDLI